MPAPIAIHAKAADDSSFFDEYDENDGPDIGAITFQCKIVEKTVENFIKNFRRILNKKMTEKTYEKSFTQRTIIN